MVTRLVQLMCISQPMLSQQDPKQTYLVFPSTFIFVYVFNPFCSQMITMKYKKKQLSHFYSFPRSRSLTPGPISTTSRIRQHVSRRSLASRLNTHECTRSRNTSGTLTILGTIFDETAEEKPFISKRYEINCGIFSYFSRACVFHILSPIFSLKSNVQRGSVDHIQ